MLPPTQTCPFTPTNVILPPTTAILPPTSSALTIELTGACLDLRAAGWLAHVAGIGFEDVDCAGDEPAFLRVVCRVGGGDVILPGRLRVDHATEL